MSVVIACDPGLTGAIAILAPHATAVIDAVTESNGGVKAKIKQQVDAAATERTLKEMAEGMDIDLAEATAVIEKVGSRPGQSSQSGFSLGDSFGSLRAILELNCASIETMKPQEWMPLAVVEEGKKASLERARELFPRNAERLKRQKDHNRAEALLIGYALLQRGSEIT